MQETLKYVDFFFFCPWRYQAAENHLAGHIQPSGRELETPVSHLLATHQLKSGESLDELLRELNKLGRGYNLKAVNGEHYRDEFIRDAFINGLASPVILQLGLENKNFRFVRGL